MAKLEDIEKRIAQLQAQKKAIISKAKAKERKERNHRLIQVGALVEKYAGKIINLDSFEAYLKNYGSYIKKNQNDNCQICAKNKTNN